MKIGEPNASIQNSFWLSLKNFKKSQKIEQYFINRCTCLIKQCHINSEINKIRSKKSSSVNISNIFFLILIKNGSDLISGCVFGKSFRKCDYSISDIRF